MPARPRTRFLAIVLVLIGMLPAAAAALGRAPRVAASRPPTEQHHLLGGGAWSTFADPRVLASGSRIYVGTITPAGLAMVHSLDVRTSALQSTPVFRAGVPADDHAHPTLVVFQRRLYAFSSPHSGYRLPVQGRSMMLFRRTAGANPGALRFGPVQQVPLPRGCGLGYTYPNPVVSRRRLYLFLRGPCWEPMMTWTRDGRHWARPRTIIRRPHGRRVRPYARYAAAQAGSIAMAFSDGHPDSFPSSLFYLRLAGRRVLDAAGHRLARLRDLPLEPRRLRPVVRVSARRGRSWPQDVAVDRAGRPVIAYTATIGVTDTLMHAAWNGHAWRHSAISPAGAGMVGYRNAGMDLDHQDPWRVVLARTVDGTNEIAVASSHNRGRAWEIEPVTAGSPAPNMRPVFAHGRWPGTAIAWFSGRYSGWSGWDTTLHLVVRPP